MADINEHGPPPMSGATLLWSEAMEATLVKLVKEHDNGNFFNNLMDKDVPWQSLTTDWIVIHKKLCSHLLMNVPKKKMHEKWKRQD